MNAYHRPPAASETAYALDPRASYQQDWHVLPEDRVGPPLAARRRRRLVRQFVLVALLAGGGWAWFEGRLTWLGPVVEEAVTVITAIGSSLMQPKAGHAPGGGEAPIEAAALEPLPALSLLVPREVAEMKVAAPPAHEQTEPAGAATGDTSGTGATRPADDDAPPAPNDPLRKRAEAVGLNPELSAALLRRLTEEDYRNAGVAIRKALAQTADGDAFEWPTKRVKGRAQFRVHFVDGAGENCRRYVVTIAKTGWATTALPMERCGIKVPPPLKAAAAKLRQSKPD